MNNIRTKIVSAAAVIALGAGASIAYALLPSTTVPPASVGIGTLVGATGLNVLSVDAFTRAINQGHGSNGVLQHLHFAPGQSTGWHTHAGPNIAMIVTGSLTLVDEHCYETHYVPGQGLVSGLDVHEAIAGSEGADFYSLYFLPANADALRADASAPICASR